MDQSSYPINPQGEIQGPSLHMHACIHTEEEGERDLKLIEVMVKVGN